MKTATILTQNDAKRLRALTGRLAAFTAELLGPATATPAKRTPAKRKPAKPAPKRRFPAVSDEDEVA